MARVKRGVVARRRHKKVLKAAKGYYGARSRVFRVAKQAVIKAGQYAYRDRRVKKRNFRSLWITRINAQARNEGMSYSRLIAGLKKADIALDDLAALDQARVEYLGKKGNITALLKGLGKLSAEERPAAGLERSSACNARYFLCKCF